MIEKRLDDIEYDTSYYRKCNSCFFPGPILDKIEWVFGKTHIGVLVVHIDQFFALTELIGESYCWRLLENLNPELEKQFYRCFENCRLIAISSEPMNQKTLIFQMPDHASASLSQDAALFRENLREILRYRIPNNLYDHLDILVGWSWIKRHKKENFHKTLFQAYCEAQRQQSIRSNPGKMNRHLEYKRIIENRQLQLSYPPIIHFHSGNIIGWEVSVNGPSASYFYDSALLYEYAEEIGGLFSLETLILELALKNWTERSTAEKMFIHFNLKAIQDPYFREDAVFAIIRDYKRKPENIVFRLSESQCYGNLGLLFQNIDCCRKNGLGILIDHVGIGGLGLRIISKIKPDFLQMDPSLVSNIESIPINRVIVESYASLSEKIGSRLIAKGVNTSAEFNTISSMGIELGQGNLFKNFVPSHSLRNVTIPMEVIASTENYSNNAVPLVELVENSIQVMPNTTVEEVKEILKHSPPMSSVVIVNDLKPIGLLMKYQMDRKLSTRYGVSLFYQREAIRLMDASPLIAEKSQSLETVAKMAMNRSPQNIYDDIIVTDNGILIGTVSVKKMLECLAEVAQKERDAARADNKKIKDSLRYAKMIQQAMLPDIHDIRKHIPNSFVIWIPRDIVGGDMFLIESFPDRLIIILVDCTGHGVPGAFMTMVAGSALKRILSEETCHDPATILKRLNTLVKTTLHQDSAHSISDDGLDAAVCTIDLKEQDLTYAGAKIPLVYIFQDQVTTIKADRQSIGYTDSDSEYRYQNHRFRIETGMKFYLYTDGYVDQLGGEDRFPFGNQPFRNLLKSICMKSFIEQEAIIIQAFNEFKKNNDQQDDVMVIGFCLDDQKMEESK